MNPTLHHLARRYRASAAGKSPGATRDFTVDYESFLRRAGAEDGDARELAERELAAAATGSGGLLKIDRHPRSRIPTVIRLARDGGEAWLFARLRQSSPTEERQALAAFFQQAAAADVPARWRACWQSWCTALAASAINGDTVQPFHRDDPEGNASLLKAVTGVLNWQGPSLVRYASASITGDSKQLQALEPRILTALAAITGHSTLEAFGIHPKPRFVTLHGPLTLVYPSARLDLGAFPSAVSLTEPNLARATAVTTTARLCLTVENEDTFHALAAAHPPGVLLVLTSYAGSAVRTLLKALPDALPMFHFGDADPSGSDILRDLREKSARDIQPLPVRHFSPPGVVTRFRPFSPADQRLLGRLFDSNLPEGARAQLAAIKRAGGLQSHEQEHIPVSVVLQAIEQILP